MENNIKNSAEKLLEYVPYFEKMYGKRSGRLDKNEKSADGIATFPTFTYNEELNKFIHEVNASPFMNYNYMDVINKRKYKYTDKEIETADMEMLTAILTMNIRGERFCDGIWMSAMDNGMFLKILKRLKELTKTI